MCELGPGKILELHRSGVAGQSNPPSKFIKENGWGRELPQSSHFPSLPAYELPKHSPNCQELQRNCQPNCQLSGHKHPSPHPTNLNNATSSTQHACGMPRTSYTKRNTSEIVSHVANTSTRVFAWFHRYSSQPVLLRTHPHIVHRRYHSGIIRSFLMCLSSSLPTHTCLPSCRPYVCNIAHLVR